MTVLYHGRQTGPSRDPVEALKARLDMLEVTVLDHDRRIPQPPPRPEPTIELDWSTVGAPAVEVGARKTFRVQREVVEVRMELAGSSITGTYTARLLKNGSAVTGTSVSLTAAGTSDPVMIRETVKARSDYLQAEITAIGSGAESLTYTIVHR